MQDKKRKYSEQFVEVPSTSTDKVRVFGDVLPCAVLLDRLSANTLASITEDEEYVQNGLASTSISLLETENESEAANEPQSHQNGVPKYTLADAQASKIYDADAYDIGQLVDHAQFEPIKLIGEGNFGKVVVARKLDGIDAGKVYALKYLSIDACMQPNDIKNTISERKVLEKVHGLNFLCQMQYAFKTTNSLVYVLDFAVGGELFGHMSKQINQNGLNLNQIRLWSAQIVLALDTMHKMGIIYRDLKLENVLIDGDGNVALADFGLAQILQEPYRAFGYGGTLPYIAPEIFSYLHCPNFEVGYSFKADWWSFGVLTYEIATNTTPFGINSETDTATTAEIKALNGSCKLKAKDIAKKTGSASLGDLLKRLLIWNPETRLDINGIKNHKFYSKIDWIKLGRKQIPTIWKPNAVDASNDVDILANVDIEFVNKPTPGCVAEPSISSLTGCPELFRGFSYIAPQFQQNDKIDTGECKKTDASIVSITSSSDFYSAELYAPRMPATYIRLNAHQYIDNDLDQLNVFRTIRSNIGQKRFIMPGAKSTFVSNNISETILGKLRKNPRAIEQKKRIQYEIKLAETERKAQLLSNCRRSGRLANKIAVKYEGMC